MKIYPAGQTKALSFAVEKLQQKGHIITNDPEDATHLLLPVPSFEADGSIKGGGRLEDVLFKCPPDITVIGGNTDHPLLRDKTVIDLLKDPIYLARNASITAHCAVKLLMEQSLRTLENMPILVIGWGRIGKCLAQLLRAMGAAVTVAARKETDRAALISLGYGAVSTQQLSAEGYVCIFNTVPATVLEQSGPGIRIDLASQLGLGGENVIWARGLPNKEAPESSGALIADTIIRIGVKT